MNDDGEEDAGQLSPKSRLKRKRKKRSAEAAEAKRKLIWDKYTSKQAAAQERQSIKQLRSDLHDRPAHLKGTLV